jgi:hypothetical protein
MKVASRPGANIMIFKIFSPRKSAKKLAFLMQNTAGFCKKWIITLAFEKNANFFRRKLAKIAENCDHNIGPRFVEIVWASFFPGILPKNNERVKIAS